MSKSNHSKKIAQIFGNVKVYKDAKDDWVFLKPTDIGDLKHSAQSNDHEGWVICDGRSISRTEYSDLFSVIGTSFGTPDDDLTFKLPDARGRVLGAIGTGAGLTARTLGVLVGEERHTQTISEMPSHNHTITDPGHSHSYANNTDDQGVNTLTTQDSAADNADLSQTTGTSTTGITVNANGGGQSFNVMQPTIFIGNVFIFAHY
jgi:microcystin-dependent protein